jgi:hypothetical protein
MQDHLMLLPGSPSIPKKIHLVQVHEAWCPSFDVCLHRIKALHPDWEVKLWKRDELPDLHCQDIIDEMIDKHDNMYMATALIGLQLITEFGGVYLDLDTYLFRSIEPLTWSIERAVINRHFRYYGTHFMASKPHDPYFVRVLTGIPDAFGSICKHPIPNDIFTAAKMLYWVEENDSALQTRLRPTAYHPLHLPEFRLFENRVLKNMTEGQELPSYVRGIRMTPDLNKYHNVTYSFGSRTMFEHLEGIRGHMFRMMDDAGIIYR